MCLLTPSSVPSPSREKNIARCGTRCGRILNSLSNSPSLRRTYIDWTRGLAVLLMIEAHTLDAWTRLASRGSTSYGYAVILAGFAAPLFLWLAGVSVPPAAAARVRRGLARRASAPNVVCRGPGV